MLITANNDDIRCRERVDIVVWCVVLLAGLMGFVSVNSAIP